MGTTLREPDAFAIEIAALSDAGSKRGRNDDSCATLVKSISSGLVAIADGKAEIEGDGLASQHAIRALMHSYGELPPGMTQTQKMMRAARSASFEVYEKALVVPQLRGMRASLTAVAVSEGALTAAHVGNGRVYLLRDGFINQLSKDHTQAAEWLEENGRCPVDGHDRLTRSIGSELIVGIDFFEIALELGDVVILCTDGLHRVLEDLEIAGLVKGIDAAAACRRLVDVANARETPENLSVGIVRVVGTSR
jgi:protein phosphatase